MKKLPAMIFVGLGIFVMGSCIHKGAFKETTAPPTIAGASYVGDESCLGCHDDMAKKFGESIHGRIAGFEVVGSEKGCESCHGPGSLHAEEADPENIISFSHISGDEASAVCLTCHTQGTLMDWQGSEHALSDVSCLGCHKIHSPGAGNLLAVAEPKLCNECHQDIMAKTTYPSHHPIQEGKMVCSSCHQAHGSFLKNLKTDETLNDLCFDCHSSKQGPFTFEHEPVVEDCAICHDPHGSVANNLLVQNEPFICLQCHQAHFHAGKISAEGNAENIHGRTMNTDSHSYKAAFTTKCTQCHFQIHGSDLPSQSVPSRGESLTR